MLRKVFILTTLLLAMCVFSRAYSDEPEDKKMQPSQEFVSVRYMVDDVIKAVDFYTKELGFTLKDKPAVAPGASESSPPAFAAVARGSLRLLLSGPGSSGARPMPDGSKPVAGGWNRIQVPVVNIEAEVTRLRQAGYHFRNDILKGVGGSQIILEDPFGNPIELFQAAAKK